jgi:hypothetical protein
LSLPIIKMPICAERVVAVDAVALKRGNEKPLEQLVDHPAWLAGNNQQKVRALLPQPLEGIERESMVLPWLDGTDHQNVGPWKTTNVAIRRVFRGNRHVCPKMPVH